MSYNPIQIAPQPEDLDAKELWDGLRAERDDVVLVNISGAHMVGRVVQLAKEDKRGKPHNPERSTQWLQIRVYNTRSDNVLEITQKENKGILVRVLGRAWLEAMLAFPSSREDAQRGLGLPIWKGEELDPERAAAFNRTQAEAKKLLITGEWRTDIAKAMATTFAPLRRLEAMEKGGEPLQRRLRLVRDTAWRAFQRLDLRGGGGEADSDSEDEEDTISNSCLVARGIDRKSVVGWNTVDARWKTKSGKPLRELRAKAAIRRHHDGAATDLTWAELKGIVESGDDVVGALIQSRVFQRVEMLTISSVLGTRIHQYLAHGAIYDHTSSTDEGGRVSFPAKPCFQMLYAERPDGRIALPKVVERYWHPEMDGRGLAMLDSVARTLADRVDEALRREGLKVVGAEIPVVDTNRLFMSSRGRAQMCETRIDCLLQTRDGGLVLGELKSKIGATTQTSFLSTKEMRQALVNAFWLWTNYGVLVKDVALIYVNRSQSVYVCRIPFRPRMKGRRLTYESARALRFLKAFEREIPGIYTDENFLLKTRGGEPPETALSPFLRRFEVNDPGLAPTPWIPAVAPTAMHTVPPMYKVAEGVFMWTQPRAAGGDGLIFEFDDVLIGGRRVLEDEAHAAAREALNEAVDAACEELIPEVEKYSPNDLYLALYAWCGNARMYAPNTPVSKCSTRGVLQRTFQRMVNFELLREIEANGGWKVLNRADFGAFEHISRRRRWSAYQLERATRVYVPRVRRRLRDVLDLL